jgi:hypothetical protein
VQLVRIGSTLAHAGIATHLASELESEESCIAFELLQRACRDDYKGVAAIVHPLEANPPMLARVEAAMRMMIDRASGQAVVAQVPPAQEPQTDGAKARAKEQPESANTCAPRDSTRQGGTPPADPYADLRRFARVELKGQEKAVIEALCDAGGELLIAALAVKDGVGWEDAFKGFANVQQRLNPKLKSHRWTLVRQGNAAKLNSMKP